ncbi:MAG: CBS domain-containing protein [Chloroflexi bacterium]|nr:CBS domain-containing protein [Chloroflexota bacterium]
MLVKERMTSPALTIGPEVGVQDTLAMMRRDKVRRYPVVDRHGNLIGIISEMDLLNASPSDATSLSVWEINYLLSKLTVEKIMTKDVITITPDIPIEEAARIMADRKVGGLPVVEGTKVVGIVTETNLFRVFLELFGARTPGVRLTARVEDVPGKLVQLTNAILEIKGNIITLGTYQGKATGSGMVVIKVGRVDIETLKKAVAPYVLEITDIRLA